MGLAGDSMGTCSNALALVCVALALTNLEAVGEVEEIRDELSANPSEEAASYYNEIPGFSMIAGASEEKALNKQECQSKCSASAECASFSWKGEDKTCIVSTKLCRMVLITSCIPRQPPLARRATIVGLMAWCIEALGGQRSLARPKWSARMSVTAKRSARLSATPFQMAMSTSRSVCFLARLSHTAKALHIMRRRAPPLSRKHRKSLTR